MTTYDRYNITFSSNPEYTPVSVQDKIFSVPSDITSIDEVNNYLHELTGIFIIVNWGKIITCEKCDCEDCEEEEDEEIICGSGDTNIWSPKGCGKVLNEDDAMMLDDHRGTCYYCEECLPQN